MIIKLLNPIYAYFYHLFSQWSAHLRKKRSERALAQLDSRLLDDVGLCRVDDDIVPISQAKLHQRRKIRGQRRKQRLRHRYVLRRSRQE